MAVYCPIIKEKVLYLECIECEDKGKCSKKNEVEFPSSKINQAEPQNNHPCCRSKMDGQ